MSEEMPSEKQSDIEPDEKVGTDPYKELLEPYNVALSRDEFERSLIKKVIEVRDIPLDLKESLRNDNEQWKTESQQEAQEARRQNAIETFRYIKGKGVFTVSFILSVILAVLFLRFNFIVLRDFSILFLIIAVIAAVKIVCYWKEKRKLDKIGKRKRDDLCFDKIDPHIECLELPAEKTYLKEELKNQVSAIRNRKSILHELTDNPSDTLKKGWLLYIGFDNALETCEKRCIDVLEIFERKKDQDLAVKTADACLASVMSYILLFDQAYEQDLELVIETSEKENLDAISHLVQASKEIADEKPAH